MRAACAAAAAAALLLAVVGCGERDEPTGPLSAYPVTVQGVGEAPTRLAQAPRRVAAMTVGLHGILVELGAPVVGSQLPRRSLSRLSGARLTRALEQLRPDLIVATSRNDTRDLQRAVAATGAPLYVFPDATVEDVERGLTQLGLLTGTQVAGRGLVGRIEDAREQLGAQLRGVPVVRVFVDTGFAVSVPPESLLVDLIREAHGRSVVDDPTPAPLTPRTLGRLDPDVYLVTSDSETTLASLRRGRLRGLRAVRKGRFAVVDSSYLEAGPHVDRALLDVADALR